MKKTLFEPMDMVKAEAVLKDAKRILDRLGLVFFLRHGTCLGAVRDHAFIEWDDDLDIGSVIGLHGLTEEHVRQAANVFSENGFEMEIIDSDLHLNVDLSRSGTQMDWVCYRIVDDSIYQWPAVKIPVALHTNLKEIEFLGDRFLVPNPPEEYLRLKYGPGWTIPKPAGEFEQEVLDQMADIAPTDGAGGILDLAGAFVPERHTGSLRVLGFDGQPVAGAEIVLVATTVSNGLERSHTDSRGLVYFSLPRQASYVVTVQYGDHKEFLYQEELAPGVDYVYQPDPEHLVARAHALVPAQS